MKILGLTGGIGTGKSTAAAMLRRMGVAVFDADAAVHRLLGPGGAAVKAVARAFPGAGAGAGNAIDRTALGKIVFADPDSLRRLEAILHPLVRAEESAFLKTRRARRTRLAVLDIPLLYETRGDRCCDAVAVLWAPAFIQRARVLSRPGMDAARLAAILARQLPIPHKRRRADFAVPSGMGRAATWRGLARALERLRACGAKSGDAD
jgi:dephospho-CoA kinase